MCTVYVWPERAAASAKSAEMARGMSPRSAYRSVPPVMVNVLPLPVWPKAKTVPL